MDEKRIDDQIPEEAAPKTEDTSFVKKAAKAVWAAIRSIPGEFLNFWRSYPPKARKIAVILAAVVLVAGVVATLVFPDYTDCAFYIKDRELYLCTSDGHTRRITEKLIEDGVSEHSMSFAQRELSKVLNNYIHLSEDGRSLFYCDHTTVYAAEIGTDSKRYDLYWTDLTNPWHKPVKIATNIMGGLAVNHKERLAFSLSGGTLYQHTLRGSVTLANGVKYWKASEDGSEIIYAVGSKATQSTIYQKRGSRAPQKIAENVYQSFDTNKDMSVVVYCTENHLYIKKDGVPAVKIPAKHNFVAGISKDRSLYYYTQDVREYSQSQIVVDDWDGDSYGTYSHDSIIQMLEKTTMYNQIYTLWYFNGAGSVKISETVGTMDDYQQNDLGVYFYKDYCLEEPLSVNLSELIQYCSDRNIKDVTDGLKRMVNEILERNARYYVCVGAVKTKTDLGNVYKMWTREDGEVVYALTNYKDGRGNLYKINMYGCFAGPAKLVNEQVGTWGLFTGNVSYSSKHAGEHTILYMNEKEVSNCAFLAVGGIESDGIMKSSFLYNDRNWKLYYLTSGKELMEYNGWKSKEICPYNVEEFTFTERGNVLFKVGIENSGKLWLWNGLRSTVIDEGITALVPVESFMQYR